MTTAKATSKVRMHPYFAIYMDENVPRQIAVGLHLRGIDVVTVQEDGRAGMPDPQVLARATELARVLFSRDDDLLALAHQRQKRASLFQA